MEVKQPGVSMVLNVEENSQVGEARRLAIGMGSRLGFDETDVGRISIVATEIANNLVKHGGGGSFVISPHLQGGPGLDLLGIDKGPGMKDVRACLQDGFSTAGTPGTGLGSIQRLSSGFDLWSKPTNGTVVLARFCLKNGVEEKQNLRLGMVCLPMKGEVACGDNVAVHERGPVTQLLVIDGLGHGPEASKAAADGIATFQANAGKPPAEILREMHLSQRKFRGAAASIAAIDKEKQEVSFCGIGNVAGVVVKAGVAKSLISFSGTLGAEMRTVQTIVQPFPRNALLVMHSDGLQTRWDLGSYNELQMRDPAVIAALLYRDFQRGRDDVTVLVAKINF
ncbi:MAG: ATP-binding SpoIIE family protein phosphatase [Verrucomicrobiota bacterium]|nr:ATP-binding SpoIIE family protein phosphatase [Verrucomicrobiota bacterium]